MHRLLGGLLILLAAASPLLGQAARGSQGRSYKTEEIIYLSGEVVLSTAAPLPNIVAIERHCRGQVFPEGFTDQQGSFAVRLGSRADAGTEDASTYGVDSRGRASGDTMRVGGLTGESERHSSMKGKGTVDLIGCELRAVLPGYIADPVVLGRRSVLEDSNIGTIVLRPLGKPGAVMVSATGLDAPQSARKLYDHAHKRLRGAKPDLSAAEKDLLRAVEIHPRYADAWNLLGKVRVETGSENTAAEAFSQALAADEMLLSPYRPLIKLTMRSGDWNRTIDLAQRYLELDPTAAEERFYLGLAQQQTGQVDQALATLDRLFSDPKAAAAFPQARHVQGSLFAGRGRYKEAAEAWTLFAEAVPDSPAAAEVNGLIAEWRTLGVIE